MSPVENLSFIITEIDSGLQGDGSLAGAGFSDTVVVSILPTYTSSVPAGSSVTGAGTAVSPFINSNPLSYDANFPGGNLHISLAGPITTFTLQYLCGIIQLGGSQLIHMSNIRFEGACSTDSPTRNPTDRPTESPTNTPTAIPIASRTLSPTTASPTATPTDSPTESPTNTPTTSKPTMAGCPSKWVAGATYVAGSLVSMNDASGNSQILMCKSTAAMPTLDKLCNQAGFEPFSTAYGGAWQHAWEVIEPC